MYMYIWLQNRKHGIEYKKGAIVHIKSTNLGDNRLPLQYAEIQGIYIYRDHKVLLTSLVEVVNGDSHFRAIEVNITAQLCICLSEDLYCHGVLHLLRCGLHTYLVEKDNRVPSSFYY